MPYKDPERKRQWEREHREQRNAMRRMQPARSGHASVSKATSDIVAALRTRRKQASDPVSDQKPKSTWKTILGWAVGIGVVLLATVAAVNVSPNGAPGSSTGSGNSGM